jgi:hypothetical protein
MKVCPVCNETFADEMKFCDLDGTRLARQAEATGAPAHHRTWSLLGVGLLVGALVLSAVSVFMIPRSRALPTATSSSTPATPSTGKPADSGNSASAGDSAAAPSDQPEIVIAETPPDPNAKKKDKTKPTAENDAASPLNPKAAAQTGEETATPAPVAAEPPPAPKKTEPAPTPKTASETREPESAPKPVAAPDPKRDPKHSNATKDSDKKREEDKDKKKGGGFFKVFKKIFGKD